LGINFSINLYIVGLFPLWSSLFWK